MEFYEKGDFIYPNMYATQDIVGYTSGKHAVSNGVDNKLDEGFKKDEDLSKQTNSFHFTTLNPYFHIQENDLKDLHLNDADSQKIRDIKEKLVIPTDEYYSVSNKKLTSGLFFTHNFNEMTAQFSGIFSYLSSDIKSDDSLKQGP